LGGGTNPDAPPAPVNAVPAPSPVSTPSGGDATLNDVVEQLKQMQGKQKSVVEKLKEDAAGGLRKHVESVITNPSKEVGGNKIDSGHMRDFD
jgi:type IV secretion system protein TrbL